MDIKLENLIVELELYLQRPEVRCSKAELERLLSDDFLEFAATGASFGKKEVLARLPDERAPIIETCQFEVREITADVCQVIYRAKLKKVDENITRFSLRSSIWRKLGHNWQMLFHQGTSCRPF